MDDVRSAFAARSSAQASTATLLGQVMFLVAVAIAFMALGTYVGRELSTGTARILSFAGFGMLIAAAFVQRLRVGPLGIGWLYATALMIGLGLGPVIAYFVANHPSAITQAAGGTALTVTAMGALGFALSKDLAPFMRPLSLLVFAVIVSIGLMLFTTGANPIISIIIYVLSAALITVDFNYLRKHGTEADAIWLATGIFVSIVNIFLSLLNLFGE